MLTFGSLFAGIGGFDLGLERAGMRCLWQVEIDEFCQKVLAKHWPNVMRYGDVRECGSHNLSTVDLICGGFPCQPHSYTGKRGGAADDRNLWPEYRRIIAELNPTWVIGENVPGIITTILDEVLFDLEGAGYEVATFSIPACAVNAPHRRDRVWIIAHADSGGQQGQSVSVSIRRSFEAESNISWVCSDVAHADDDTRKETIGPTGRMGWKWIKESGQAFIEEEGICWFVEPAVGRMANGIPDRVDRLRVLGNAVVPQVVEWIGRCIVEYEQLKRERAEEGQMDGEGAKEQRVEYS